jgi:hypothetical protein
VREIFQVPLLELRVRASQKRPYTFVRAFRPKTNAAKGPLGVFRGCRHNLPLRSDGFSPWRLAAGGWRLAAGGRCGPCGFRRVKAMTGRNRSLWTNCAADERAERRAEMLANDWTLSSILPPVLCGLSTLFRHRANKARR